MYNIKIRQLHRLDNNPRLKAFVDIAVADLFLIKGLRIINGKKGLFVGMPRRQGRDGQWYQTVFPLNKDVSTQLNEVILQAYQER